MLPPPAPGAMPSKGDKVAVYYLEAGWCDGEVVRCSGGGKFTHVRFDDGQHRVELTRKSYGRFAKWVACDTSRDEQWSAAGHPLVGNNCDVRGRDATVRMWCEARALFATCSVDEEQEVELTLEEAEAAVRAHTRRNGGPHPIAPERLSPLSGAGDDETAIVVADGANASTVAGSDSQVAYDVPWPLAWEFERLRQLDGWRPSEGAHTAIREEWKRIDAKDASEVIDADPDESMDAADPDKRIVAANPETRIAVADQIEAAPCAARRAAAASSDQARLVRHRKRLAAVRREIDPTKKALVLPFAPRGFVIRYRARVSSGGKVQVLLLEARRDVRTFAHSLFGEEAWLHVEFDDLPDGQVARDRERRAQQRVLREGIAVCGRRFVCFGKLPERHTHCAPSRPTHQK